MPLYVSVPLPGPLRYGRRIGGGRPPSLGPVGGVVLGLLVLAWIVSLIPVPVLVLGAVVLAVLGYRAHRG